jgi:uncharacterized protein YgiM (DUF1202 family)
MLCASISLYACSSESPAKGKASQDKYSGIILSDNTSLRVDPFIFSSKIDMLSKGETVEIIDKSEARSIIGGGSDYWYKVRLSRGVSGWVYGKTIKIVQSSRVSSDDYLAEFWEKEADTIKKEISGKWWSVNEAGDFTNHCIEISSDGTYKSYTNNNPGAAIEGEYNFDFNKNEIVFLKGTSFNNNLSFIKRGSFYVFKAQINKQDMTFKKIQAR